MAERYSGRKSTIEAYKKERKRIMGIITSLQKRGVTVPEVVVPKQGGKVTYKDVQRLKNLDREKIARKSFVTVNIYKGGHGQGLFIEKVTVKGKEVLYELRKQINRERIERAKLRSDIAVDPVTGAKYYKSTGEVVYEPKKNKNKKSEKQKEAEAEKKRKEEDEQLTTDWLNAVKEGGGQLTEEDISEEGTAEESDSGSQVGDWIDSADAILSSWMRVIDDNKHDPSVKYKPDPNIARSANEFQKEVAGNTWDTDEYLKQCLDSKKYTASDIAKALLQLENMGFQPEERTFYKEKYTAFSSALHKILPLGDIKEDQMNNNDIDYNYDEADEI